MILGGTLIAIDRRRGQAVLPRQAQEHGISLQVIASPDGTSCGCPAHCPDRSTISNLTNSFEWNSDPKVQSEAQSGLKEALKELWPW
jgi:hypothetical protein